VIRKRSVESPESCPKTKVLFRAFRETDFRPTGTWTRIETILSSNGGAYGINGPRGCGKTWLMLKARKWAFANRGIGLWYPSPSEYDPFAFLCSLADNFASAVEDHFLRYGARRRRLSYASMLFFIVAVLATSALLPLQSVKVTSLIPDVIAIGAMFFVSIQLYLLSRGGGYTQTAKVIQQAIALRQRIRFTAVLNSGSDLQLATSRFWNTGFTLRRERSLSDRPVTTSSLVYDFRNLAELAATVLPGPIVIAIDELDKLERPDAFRSLLRDIKAIFEISGVHFLVSVSDEAVKQLSRSESGLTDRDVFNSSFYTIISVPPLSPSDACSLIESRLGMAMPPHLIKSLCVLGAGNQREFIRLADSTWQFFAQCSSTVVCLIHLSMLELCESIDSLLSEDSDGVQLSDSEKTYARRILGHGRTLRESIDNFSNPLEDGVHHPTSEQALLNERQFISAEIELDTEERMWRFVAPLVRAGTATPIWRHNRWIAIVLRIYIGWMLVRSATVGVSEREYVDLRNIVDRARQAPDLAHRHFDARYSDHLQGPVSGVSEMQQARRDDGASSVHS
jgi:KAP family P-loop domain